MDGVEIRSVHRICLYFNFRSMHQIYYLRRAVFVTFNVSQTGDKILSECDSRVVTSA